VWDTASGKELLNRTVSGRRLLAISPDGERIVVPVGVEEVVGGGWRRIGRIEVINVMDNAVAATLEFDSPPDFCTAAFSADGARLATVSEFVTREDGRDLQARVQLWDIATGRGQEIAPRSSKGALVHAVSLSPDGAFLGIGYQLQASGAGVIDVWETATGRKLHTLRGHPGRVMSIVFSPDSRRIVSAGADGSGAQSELRIWDVAAGKEITTWTCRGGVTGLAFRPDGYKLLAVRDVSPDSELLWQVWDGTPRASPTLPKR
jgi:WD40 repeat protein